jgi:hypothetical protein
MSESTRVLGEEDGADQKLLSHEEKQNGVKIVAPNGHKNDIGTILTDFSRVFIVHLDINMDHIKIIIHIL